MEALLDNDLLHKLARYELLAEFEVELIARGFVLPFGKLPSAPWAMKTEKRPLPPAIWPNPSQAATFRTFCFSKCRSITGSQSATLSALNVPAFDAGEIILVARALNQPASLVFTGDKRAIEAVATDPALATQSASLQGRFVHLEMVMKVLSERLGYGHVAALVTAAGVDIRLQAIYSRSTEGEMRTSLHLSIGDLRSRTGGLLAAAF